MNVLDRCVHEESQLLQQWGDAPVCLGAQMRKSTVTKGYLQPKQIQTSCLDGE